MNEDYKPPKASNEYMKRFAESFAPETQQATDFLRSDKGIIGMWVVAILLVVAFVVVVVAGL